MSALTVCVWCGEAFEPATERSRFCSDRCRYRLRDRQRYLERGTQLEAACDGCGESFAYESGTKRRKYCFECSPVKPPREGARRCARCGNPATSQKHRYCDVCRVLVAKPKARSWRELTLPPTARGYGSAHKALRQRWKRVVDRGGAVCVRCGLPIWPGSAWDLGHSDDRRSWTGPEHSHCNRAAGGRVGGLARARRTSREW